MWAISSFDKLFLKLFCCICVGMLLQVGKGMYLWKVQWGARLQSSSHLQGSCLCLLCSHVQPNSPFLPNKSDIKDEPSCEKTNIMNLDLYLSCTTGQTSEAYIWQSSIYFDINTLQQQICSRQLRKHLWKHFDKNLCLLMYKIWTGLNKLW